MDNLVVANKENTTDNKAVRFHFRTISPQVATEERNEIATILMEEGGEALFNYVEWLGLLSDPDIIVLSSRHHYYYTEEELKRIETIINLKQLNLIKDLGEMLKSVFTMMPSGCNFIGCFAEKNKHLEYIVNSSENNGHEPNNEAVENGIISRFPIINMIYNFIDFRTNRYMTKKDVTNLFESFGFTITDMTELNGLTFFMAKKKLLHVE